MFLKHIRMIVKDHVTLKTGVITAENSALPSFLMSRRDIFHEHLKILLTPIFER